MEPPAFKRLSAIGFAVFFFLGSSSGIAEALKKGLKLTHKQKRIVKKHQAGVFSNARLEGSGRGGKRRRASSAPSTSPRGRGRAGGRGGGNLSAESLPTVDQVGRLFRERTRKRAVSSPSLFGVKSCSRPLPFFVFSSFSRRRVFVLYTLPFYSGRKEKI